ncbi:MAG: type II secretion system GspH family protein [Candidatus Riflebacteria bacterium]|nr:type II secretion system GspH family protein [Candidatus Riflebacteria bacterium]
MSKTDREMTAGSCRHGVTLVEILIALVIMALAILPAIGAFTSSYGTATRQLEEEIALKLGESVVSVLLTANYDQLISGTLGTLPLNIQTPDGDFSGALNFTGMTASSSAVVIGRASYSVSVAVSTLFRAQNIEIQHDDALVFSFRNFELPPGPPVPFPPPDPLPPGLVATYSCFDNLVCLKVRVDYGHREAIELETFRADMSQ